MDCLRNLTKEKQRWWWIWFYLHQVRLETISCEAGTVHPSCLTFSSVRQKWNQLEGLPRLRFKLGEKKNNGRTSEISAVSCLELSVTANHIYFVCTALYISVHYDMFVTSTRFRIRVNINLVNTTVQPKGNMPDHLYHGNMKCFLWI